MASSRPRWPSLVATLVVMATAQSAGKEDVMTNQWHVHLVGDLGKDAAMNVAKRNGFSFVSPVSSPPIPVCTTQRYASALRPIALCLSVCPLQAGVVFDTSARIQRLLATSSFRPFRFAVFYFVRFIHPIAYYYSRLVSFCCKPFCLGIARTSAGRGLLLHVS